MNKTMRRHIIFWIVYLIWDIIQVVLSLVMAPEQPKNVWLVATYSGLADMFLKVILFYVLYYFVYKPAVRGLRPLYITVTATVVITLSILFLQRVFMFYFVMPQLWHYNTFKLSFYRFYSMVVMLFDMLVPVCLLFIYELYTDSKQRRQREAQLENEKLQSELRFLKSQINPHFLFNVLGTIHALTRNQAPKAADVTIRLSKIMRFMLYEAGCTRISLAEEIRILDDYMALEKIRFSNKLNMTFIKEITDDTLKIAPLILLPFVENAFKHGTAESQFNSAIQIKLVVKGKELLFEVHNSVEQANIVEKEKGIGLTNIRRQLQLLYPHHDLRILHGEKRFSVYLNLQL